MAKNEMVCPFSDRACKNCSLYIGRHYLLCYKSQYRGYMKNTREDYGNRVTGPYAKEDFSVPELVYIEELDVLSRLDQI